MERLEAALSDAPTVTNADAKAPPEAPAAADANGAAAEPTAVEPAATEVGPVIGARCVYGWPLRIWS